VTFMECCAVLAANVSELLKLNGPRVEAVNICLSPAENQCRLLASNDGIPHLPPTRLYSLTNVRNFEIFNKLGTKHAKQAEKTNSGLCDNFHDDTKKSDYANIAESENIQSTTRHRVYIIMQKRKLRASFVCDVAPMKCSVNKSCEVLVLTMPTCVGLDFTHQLTTAAYQCCVETGVVSGVCVVEMFLTSTGPKLIRITPHLDSLYIRDWIQRLYGVDILLAALLVACDVDPIMFGHLEPPFLRIVGYLTASLFTVDHCEHLCLCNFKNTVQYNSIYNGSCHGFQLKQNSYHGSVRVYSDGHKKFLCRNSSALESKDHLCNGFRDINLQDCQSVCFMQAAVTVTSPPCLLSPSSPPCLLSPSSGGARNINSRNCRQKQNSEGVRLLKLLSENGTICVTWSTRDPFFTNDSCLIYCMDDNRQTARKKLEGVLSIVGLCHSSSLFTALIDNYAVFDI